MTEAWHLHEFRQQKFLEELEGEVRDQAEESPNYDRFIVEFLIAILVRFRFEINPDISAAHDIRTNATWLLDKMTPRVRAFARVESEERWLLFRLFDNLRQAVGSWAQSDYLRDQIEQPQAVFGAPSAMAELEDE